MADLKDKVAIVTGASSGIGASTVTKLLQSGMKVVGLARRKNRIEELGKGFEGKLFAVETDITKEDDIIRAFKWSEENVGPVYVLINNAGFFSTSAIDEAQTENLRRILETNLLAVSLFTREAVKSMKTNNIDGSIININSDAGHYILTAHGFSMYVASKHGLTAFTESIRLELAKSGSKIRISSLSPGLVETDMSVAFHKDNPFIKSEDVANGVLYILSQPQNVNVAELTIRPNGGSL